MTNPFTGKTRLVNDQESYNKALVDGYIDVESELRGDSDGSYMENQTDTQPHEEKMEHTKENILSALEDTNILNAAISHLGDLQTADELASGSTNHLNGQGFSAAFAKTGKRLWMWVTGKDPKTMEVRWDPKCLAHSRASRAFAKQLNNYEDLSEATDLAKYVAGFHWKQLAHILKEDFVGYSLPQKDEKRSRSIPTQWTSLTGAKVLQVKGGGTQLLWDSRKVWLPSSQLKTIAGELKIPTWLAVKNEMV